MRKFWHFITCILLAATYLPLTHSMNRLARKARPKTTQIQKRTKFQSPFVHFETYWKGDSRKSATTKSTPGVQAAMPQKSVMAKSWEYLLNRTPFTAQDALTDTINLVKLRENITLLIKNDWDYSDADTKTASDILKKLESFKTVLNQPLFGEKTVLEVVVDDFLQTNQVDTIFKRMHHAQEIADALYALLFPSYGGGFEGYSVRDTLDKKRRNLLRYITAFTQMSATLGEHNTATLLNLLRTEHLIVTFLEASSNPKHHVTTAGGAYDQQTIAVFFEPLTEQLKIMAQKNKLDYAKLDAQAVVEARTLLENFGGIPPGTFATQPRRLDE